MTTVIELAQRLVAECSITPEDGSCQKIIAELLQSCNFQLEHLPFGKVKNLWARFGTAQPLFVFAGHTDVVPPGPIDQWRFAPFTPTIHNEMLYGRGAADMKGGLAAMVLAATNFIKKYPDFKGSIAFLITSDEEGPSLDGTKKVIEEFIQRGLTFDYCLIGEASSEKTVGDQIRIGRRGSLHGHLTIDGKQGHVAYPELANNPIHSAGPIIQALCAEIWDQGNEYFPPTSFQISNVFAGSGAVNVIPNTFETKFNFRFSSAISADEIKSRVNALLMKYPVKYSLEWNLSGKPFITTKGRLITVTCEAIQEHTGVSPKLSTGGGTSDGRFIAEIATEVIELGPINATIHQINECVNIADLNILSTIYERILEKIFLT